MKFQIDLSRGDYAEAYAILQETYKTVRNDPVLNCRTLGGTLMFILRSWSEYIASIRSDVNEEMSERAAATRLAFNDDLAEIIAEHDEEIPVLEAVSHGE